MLYVSCNKTITTKPQQFGCEYGIFTNISLAGIRIYTLTLTSKKLIPKMLRFVTSYMFESKIGPHKSGSPPSS